MGKKAFSLTNVLRQHVKSSPILVNHSQYFAISFVHARGGPVTFLHNHSHTATPLSSSSSLPAWPHTIDLP